MLQFDPTRCDILDLDSLANGMPGISGRLGASFAEAASVCLEEEDHKPGVEMDVQGDCEHRLRLVWAADGDREQRRRAWNDPEVATEHGAYGIAALLVDRLTEYTVVERAKKRTGFDFWLGKKGSSGLLFQDTARMEVSGIRRGDDSIVKARVRQKINQMKPTDGVLPGVVIVVEFGSPRTRVKTK